MKYCIMNELHREKVQEIHFHILLCKNFNLLSSVYPLVTIIYLTLFNKLPYEMVFRHPSIKYVAKWKFSIHIHIPG